MAITSPSQRLLIPTWLGNQHPAAQPCTFQLYNMISLGSSFSCVSRLVSVACDGTDSPAPESSTRLPDTGCCLQAAGASMPKMQLTMTVPMMPRVIATVRSAGIIEGSDEYG